MHNLDNVQSAPSPAADTELSLLLSRVSATPEAPPAVNAPITEFQELATLAFEMLAQSKRMGDTSWLNWSFVTDVRLRTSVERACGVLTMALAQVVRAPDATKSHEARDTALLFFQLVLPVLRQSVEGVYQWKSAQVPDARGSDEAQGLYLHHMFGVLSVTTLVLSRALEWHAVTYQAPDTGVRALFALCMARFRTMDSKAALCHPLRDTVEQALVYCLYVQHLPSRTMSLALIQDSLARLRMHSANVALQSLLAPPVVGARSGLPLLPGALGYSANDAAIQAHLRSLLFPFKGPMLRRAAGYLHEEGKACFSSDHGVQLRVQIGHNACTPNVFDGTQAAVNAKAALGPSHIDARHDAYTQWRWIHVPQQMEHYCFPQPQTPVSIFDPRSNAASFGSIRYTHRKTSGSVFLGVEVYFASVAPRLLRATIGGWPTHTNATRLYLVASQVGTEDIAVLSQTLADKMVVEDMPLQILDVAHNRYYQRGTVLASWPDCIAVSYHLAPETPGSDPQHVG